MKIFLIAFFVLIVHLVQAQPRQDSLNQIQQWAKWYNLEFTSAEADSMLGNLLQMRRLYATMHKTLPANDIPYPFAFQPAPIGFSVPMN